MTRHPLLLLLAPLLGACNPVATMQTAIPDSLAVSEPRLVGTWDIMDGGRLDSHLLVTEESGRRYFVRWLPLRGDSLAMLGRLGPLDAGRLVLELSRVTDTSWARSRTGQDSVRRLDLQDEPLTLPIRMPIVVEPADSGLSFAFFDSDSVDAQLRSARLKTPFVVWQPAASFGSTLLLTESDPRRLNAALRGLAKLPGVLQPIPRVGRRIILPSRH